MDGADVDADAAALAAGDCCRTVWRWVMTILIRVACYYDDDDPFPSFSSSW